MAQQIRVTDEATGKVHVFPAGTTPEEIESILGGVPSQPAPQPRMVDFKDGQRPDTGTVTPGELAMRVLPIALGGAAGKVGKLAITRMAAPRVIGQKAIETGVLDPSGRMVTRSVTEYGPSVLSSLFRTTKDVAPAAIKSAAKFGALGAGGTALYRIFGGK